MDEPTLRAEIAALRDLLERLADSRASRQDWDDLMDRADEHLVTIAECLDAILETDGRLARRIAEILEARESGAGTDPGGPDSDAP
jgi:hypothetical protein